MLCEKDPSDSSVRKTYVIDNFIFLIPTGNLKLESKKESELQRGLNSFKQGKNIHVFSPMTGTRESEAVLATI